MIGERMTGIMDYIDIARQIIEERLYEKMRDGDICRNAVGNYGKSAVV